MLEGELLWRYRNFSATERVLLARQIGTEANQVGSVCGYFIHTAMKPLRSSPQWGLRKCGIRRLSDYRVIHSML
jgi:hypothetical protein